MNPVGRPHLPFVNFDTDFIPWYFLILVIGAAVAVGHEPDA